MYYSIGAPQGPPLAKVGSPVQPGAGCAAAAPSATARRLLTTHRRIPESCDPVRAGIWQKLEFWPPKWRPDGGCGRGWLPPRRPTAPPPPPPVGPLPALRRARVDAVSSAHHVEVGGRALAFESMDLEAIPSPSLPPSLVNASAQGALISLYPAGFSAEELRVAIAPATFVARLYRT